MGKAKGRVTRAEVLVRPPGSGEILGIARVKAALDDFYIAEYTIEAGSEPGEPHYHRNHSDSFYVLEGELEFRIDGKAIPAPAGSLVAAPRGAVHAFPICPSGRARFINLHTPGGFDQYLRELMELRSKGKKPTADFYERHDIYLV